MRSAATATALVALLTLVPISVAAPWLQDGADAGRTGLIDGAGLPAPDVAFRVPGVANQGVAPLVIEGVVYALAGDLRTNLNRLTEPPPGEVGLVAIDLSTAQVRPLLGRDELGENPTGLTSDGERLFIVGDEAIMAYTLDGAPAWSEPVPVPPPADQRPRSADCLPGALDQDVLYLLCVAYGARSEDGTAVPPFGPSPARTSLVAIAPTTGDVLWSRLIEVQQPRPEGRPAAVEDPLLVPAALAVGGGHVAIITDGSSPSYGATPPVGLSNSLLPTELVLGVYDAADGSFLWDWAVEVGYSPDPVLGFNTVPDYVNWRAPHGLVVSPSTVFIKAGPLHAFRASTGQLLWSEVFDDDGQVERDGSALRAGTLYTTDIDTLHAVDVETHTTRWSARLPSGYVFEAHQSWLATSDHVVTMAKSQAGIGLPALYALFAFELATGELAWQYVISTGTFTFGGLPEPRYAMAEGVIVVDDRYGNITVLGTTPAAIGLDAASVDAFPAPGEPVALDLSRTRPGVFDDEVQVRIEWGDGHAQEWTAPGVHEHAYATQGGHTITVQARNDAGQTATRTYAIDVGGQAPASGLAGAARTAFTGDSSVIAWSLLLLLAVASVVTAGAVARARSERARADATTGPAPTRDATDVYREALEHALSDTDEITDKDRIMLSRLRAKLGLTDRDHALLEHAIRTGGATITGLELAPGASVLGKHEIIRLLGEGGHGATYLARDTVLGRHVVVKVLHPGMLSPEELLGEARMMSTVRHPNVVTVFDVDRVGEHVFIVMEHMAGGSLAERLADGPLDRPAFAHVARDLLTALGAVHARGTVHRDVKPANVLLEADGGTAKLADFGIAFAPGLEATMAAFGTVEQAVGTIPYMAPEQAVGRAVSERSDLFSAALVLYEAWTRERYFQQAGDESVVELQMRVARGGPPDVAAIEEPGLAAWFERALAGAPGARFASAGEMLTSLEEALAR